ncbi:uncharacterized protein LOC108250398 [Kryptolebias marmoratus]|uniref:uncharacterized protein LOC108250398 n=1 Tax=Kryptolebias marmoratus TaxID=37003 RepID=UPI0007F8B45B|nr:uncharacterized protein LOC108250398 [Kryptolebias marmoratus]
MDQRRAGVPASSSEDTFSSVLQQMLQQQKHKPGRRFKRKTLVKMAKLFVIAKGWDNGGQTGSSDRKRQPETEHKMSTNSTNGDKKGTTETGSVPVGGGRGAASSEPGPRPRRTRDKKPAGTDETGGRRSSTRRRREPKRPAAQNVQKRPAPTGNVPKPQNVRTHGSAGPRVHPPSAAEIRSLKTRRRSEQKENDGDQGEPVPSLKQNVQPGRRGRRRTIKEETVEFYIKTEPHWEPVSSGDTTTGPRPAENPRRRKPKKRDKNSENQETRRSGLSRKVKRSRAGGQAGGPEPEECLMRYLNRSGTRRTRTQAGRTKQEETKSTRTRKRPSASEERSGNRKQTLLSPNTRREDEPLRGRKIAKRELRKDLRPGGGTGLKPEPGSSPEETEPPRTEAGRETVRTTGDKPGRKRKSRTLRRPNLRESADGTRVHETGAKNRRRRGHGEDKVSPVVDLNIVKEEPEETSSAASIEPMDRSVCPEDCRKTLSPSSCLQEGTAVSGVLREADGFVVSRGDGELVFKCPVCKQLHRHWCPHVLQSRGADTSPAADTSRRCDACGHWYERPGGAGPHCSVCCRTSGEEEDRTEEEGLRPTGSGAVTSPASSGLRPRGQASRRLCGRCGRRFPRWNKLWLHRRLHQQGGGAFRCSRCELEFHFLGSYVHHLQGHAAETPGACPSCPGAVPGEVSLKPPALSCRTCEKRFSVRRNLKKHKLLHKRRRAPACPPCSRPFSCHAPLTARPGPAHDPFVFPFCCRKCPGRFSSAELLRAHQVCHFLAGSTLDATRDSAHPPRLKLPVSNRKDLFRYPHPDRLYVVSSPPTVSPPPTVSSPPAVVSSSEDEADPDGSESSLQLKLLIQSLIPERCRSDASDSESDADAERSDPAPCAVCPLSFTDAISLHQHYRDHAGGRVRKL